MSRKSIYSSLDPKIIIFSGAGLDAPSGIKTFRDSKDGLWNNYSLDEVCNFNTFNENKDKVNTFYNKMRNELTTKSHNKAHFKIKELYEKYPDKVINITMNVTDFFERLEVPTLHVHGELNKAKCLDCSKEFSQLTDITEDSRCEFCGSDNLKTSVIFFNEPAPRYMDLYNTMHHLENPESIIIIIGTSGEVIDVDDFVRHKPCIKILCNKEKSRNIKDKLYTHKFYGDISDTIDDVISLVEDLEEQKDV